MRRVFSSANCLAGAFALSVSILVTFASGCSSTESTLETCNPACAPDEGCDNGVCRPRIVDGGTDAGIIIDAGSPTDAGMPDAGCTKDSQCAPGVCDATTKSCVASLCDPTCPNWETCTGRTCELNAGQCNTNTDCPSADPICGSDHTCSAPPVTAPATISYAALIITNAAYAPAFGQLATMHTLTGVPTRVETIEDICAAAAGGCSTSDACHDTSKAIKDYLIAQHALGIDQVVLGGDASIVPSRSTEAKYSNAIYGVTYDETFLSDYYFSDLSEWDSNHDCVYGDVGNDNPTYLPAIGITRISVSTQAELQTYIGKVKNYLTNYDTTRINKALFLSNVATDVTIPGINITVPIDAALYFQTPGRGISLVPNDFDLTRLYSSLQWPGSQPLTVQTETQAFQDGYNLAVHSGHGAEEDVTVEMDGSNEFTGDMAYALRNTQTPILISCACEAATFADGDGCAGQQFITAPNGGGIGYLGNSTIGLGIAGGMQLLDAFMKYAFSKTNPLVGDALVAAHANLPTSDGLTIPNVPLVGNVLLPVVEITSWRWTQKATTYLGDGLLPIYTDVTMSAAPQFAFSKTLLGDFTTLTITPSAGAVGTFSLMIGSDIYQLPINGTAPVSLTVNGQPAQATYGFSSSTTLSAYQLETLP